MDGRGDSIRPTLLPAVPLAWNPSCKRADVDGTDASPCRMDGKWKVEMGNEKNGISRGDSIRPRLLRGGCAAWNPSGTPTRL